MKLIPVILSILLACSALGYGMHASAQTPCTASQPCAPICGDHLCAPGETPTSSTTGSSASTTKAVAQTTNQTGTSVTTQMNISANATTTKNANGTKNNANGITMTNSTMTGKMMNGTMTGTMKNSTMTNSTMTGKMMNGTMTTGSMNSMPMASKLPSPNAQITAGAQPANVKCMSGYYLVINNANSRPACVTQNTMSVLEARGWGHAVA